MVDFVTEHVKPLEVIVHLPAAGGCPVLEPLVFAPAELGQRLRTNLLEPAHVNPGNSSRAKQHEQFGVG